MSLGEKIRDCRKKAGLSQEQLAEKLCVSRQAITKWEADRGMPDVGNLQNISKLFGISVDYLLDDGEDIAQSVIKESIDIHQYKKDGKCRSKYDAVVKAKYPDADVIFALVREKKLSVIENVIDFITASGVLKAADALNDTSAWYLVEIKYKQLLVNVTKEFIESREINCHFTERKRVIGNNIFKKLYTI